MDHARAVDIALLMIEKSGYDVFDPKSVNLDIDLHDTELLWSRWQGDSSEADQRESLLLSLLGTFLISDERSR